MKRPSKTTLVRKCPTCGTAGKDKDGNRCLECGGAGRALPDFANRFSLKHDLLRVEGILRCNRDHHLPSAEELDADDAEALNKLLVLIRDLTASIHDQLIPPGETVAVRRARELARTEPLLHAGIPAVASSSRLSKGVPIKDDDDLSFTLTDDTKGGTR